MAGGERMNNNLISRQIEEYIVYKRSLGYQIKVESEELKRFAAYTMDVGYEGSLTPAIVLQWVTLKKDYSRWYMSRRLETVRTFAKYICVFDPKAQVPPKGIFGKCHGRVTPYIFTENEIQILMKHASKLNSPDGLRKRTITTAIGLLVSTGMRPGELCNLENDDVDLNNGLITIRETKFSKSRIIPLHKTTIIQLRSYVNDRDKLRSHYNSKYFMIMTNSNKLKLCNFEYALQIIRNNLLTTTKWTRRPPRLYDFRHTFACNTLLNWLKNGVDINNKILYLSTYLGHVKISDTYWYLTGTPELMQLASKHFEDFFYGNGGSTNEEL